MRRAHIAVIFAVSVVLAGCGNQHSPLAQLRAEVRNNPDSLAARLALADASLEAEHYHDAFIQYSAARELDESSFDAVLGVATAQERLNDVDGAIASVNEALALKPGEPDALALQGRLMLRMNEPAEAVEVLTEALQAEPENEEAHRFLPIAYLRTGQLAEAEEAGRAAVMQMPDRVDAHLTLANTLIAREKTDEAETVLRKAMELDPADAVPPLRLAELLVREERGIDEVMELTERSARLDSGEGNADAVAAIALRREGRNEEALRRLNAAAMAHPRNVRLWLMLAVIYRDLGEDEAAARSAAMAFRFAPRRRVRAAGTDTPADGAAAQPPAGGQTAASAEN
ncbi:MAG: tetratricopeptide repeat protein [Armatimonadota bacterium]